MEGYRVSHARLNEKGWDRSLTGGGGALLNHKKAGLMLILPHTECKC